MTDARIKRPLLQGWRGVAAASVAMVALAAFVEILMGRALLGPDGRFGWWEGNIWSAENSQRFADPYSFTHITHGIVMYGLLWLAARKMPASRRFLMALAIEAGWEMLENSPIIIARYRADTISLGYTGDSVLNSMSDILMMCVGFALAWRLPWRVTLALALAMEIGCAFWVRDSLVLNIIMLIHPIPAIKAWQMAAAPAKTPH